MTTYRSIISIIKAAKRDLANAVLNQVPGFGPGTYGAYLDTVPNAWPPSHYVSAHATTTPYQRDVWEALLHGVLPEIDGEWGEEGLPTEVDAIAAFTGGNVIFDCITHTDPEGFDFDGHFQAIIASQGLVVTNPPE